MNAQQRQYLYNIATVLAPILVAYGVIAASEVSLWIGLVGALLGFASNATASTTLSHQRRDGIVE